MYIENILPAVVGSCSGLLTYSVVAFFNTRKKKIVEHSGSEISDSDFSFSGNLTQTPLIEAAQFLRLGKRDGILHIYSGRRKGYLTLSKGNVIDGFYRNHTGKEAVIRMFDITEGDFYFEAKKIYQPRLINESLLDLTFEWDERKQSGEAIDDD